MLTAAFVAILPIGNAHYPGWTVPTWTYISATNNPIGVNQPTTLIYWSDKYPPTAVGAYGDRWTFYVDITKPDGSKETRDPSPPIQLEPAT